MPSQCADPALRARSYVGLTTCGLIDELGRGSAHMGLNRRGRPYPNQLPAGPQR